MKTLRQCTLLLVFTGAILIFFFVFAGVVPRAQARLTDEDQAAQDASEAAESQTVETLPTFEPSDAAKASIARREAAEARRQRHDRNEARISASEEKVTENTTTNTRTRATGNNNNEGDADINERAKATNKGFFGRIWDKIRTLFGGSSAQNKDTDEGPRVFPRKEGRTNNQSETVQSENTDLLPQTTKVNVAETYTTFIGHITLISDDASAKDVCDDAGTSYSEGDRTQTLTNSDGSMRSIADASFVCRDGAWKTEGSYPSDRTSNFKSTGPQTAPAGDVLGARTTQLEEGTRTLNGKTPYVIGTFPTNDGARHGTADIMSNMLLIDYSCNSIIDVEKNFNTPYKTLQSGTERIIPLSMRVETGPVGKHCFAFKVDTTNVITETDEGNNQTSWHTFTVESGVLPADASVCPLYSQPLCGPNQTVIAGTMQADACTSAPRCVTTTADITPDDLTFEVKSYMLSDETDSGASARITSEDWSSDNITLEDGEALSFRWDASKYDKCLVNLHPEKYVFNESTTAVTGNTEASGIVLKALTGNYTIECTTGENIYKKEINVRVF